jgi:putative pyruvate formate lyase activating enzyme
MKVKGWSGMVYPVYLSLDEDQWKEKIERSDELASPCILCGRRCGVDRSLQAGICKAKGKAIVSSVGPHFGEEPPLVGRKGSGTIFFSGCNLECIYCQNYEISHLRSGRRMSNEELSKQMLKLQRWGCHNINLVSPTHEVPNILRAIKMAAEDGLNIPIVYNTGGYDSIETVELLDGVVDIYMPDMKYGDEKYAMEYSKVAKYPEINFAAVKEMHRQVGDLVIGEDGVAIRGLIVRHLVLPNGLANTKKVMDFIAQEISKDSYVNIMAQYRPCFEAINHPLLGRGVTREEYQEALEVAVSAGLTRLEASGW